MTRNHLDGSSSICVDPRYSPINYWWYRSDPSRSLRAEVRATVATMGLGQDDQDRLVGQFFGAMRALVMGNLVPLKHIKGPMESATNLEVFEVRAGIDYGSADRAELRAYHVEPRQLTRSGGSAVIGLHVHSKDLTALDINGAQDEEIAKAVERFFDGRKDWWGGATLPGK